MILSLTTGSADLNAIFYGQQREETGGVDAPTSSSSVNSGNNASNLLSPKPSGNGGLRKHIIQVSTYQMCVLMLFNNREKLTYEVRSSIFFFIKIFLIIEFFV